MLKYTLPQLAPLRVYDKFNFKIHEMAISIIQICNADNEIRY